MKSKIDLRKLFLGLQGEMLTKLSTAQINIPNPGAKGNVAELSWMEMLEKYLPKRYQVEKAFVLDSTGQVSDEIDLVIFDRQYSPFLFNREGALFVPAESVYAVIEVKPVLNAETIRYAGSKTETVRRLKRTSTTIPHAGGFYPPKKLYKILGGIVTRGCDWKSPLESKLPSAISQLSEDKKINFGCALEEGAFIIKYNNKKAKPRIETSQKDDSLIFFFLNLLSSLQQLATVPAIDIQEYAKSLRTNTFQKK